MAEASNRSRASVFALVFTGSVSRLWQSHDGDRNHKGLSGGVDAADLYKMDVGLTPLARTAASHRRHIIDANGGERMWDLIIHCWNPELEPDFRKEYGAMVVSAAFEGASRGNPGRWPWRC